jgi:hypothetical protein
MRKDGVKYLSLRSDMAIAYAQSSFSVVGIHTTHFNLRFLLMCVSNYPRNIVKRGYLMLWILPLPILGGGQRSVKGFKIPLTLKDGLLVSFKIPW